ncbi:MAG: autotransporter outer membrane beta-barrel domain-containing protein, partial [Planctomycetes bacterium]|nr:autotransporter outer membrane beta-barrel domain-containing protein [Planctomycetota bacterium]
LLAAANMMRSSFAVDPIMETRAQAGGKPDGAAADKTADVAAGLEAMWRPAREWRGFLQIDGGFGAEGSAPGGAVGYDYRGLGLLAGLERRYGEELALGALLGWTTNHGDLSQSRGEAHDNVLRLGGYGAWRWGGFFGTLAPTVGCHLLETRRHVGFMGRTARGGRTGLDVHLLGQAGYVWELPHDFLVTPEASLAMTYMHDPEYTEAGAGGACLKIDALDDWSLTQNLKLTVGKAVRLGGGFALLPEVWGGWEHEYGATNDVSCAFAAVPGMKWRVPVADIASDRAVVGAGVHALFNDRVDLYGRYELKAWKGGSFHQFSLGAGIKF